MYGAYTKDEKRALALERGILVDPEDEWLLEEVAWHITSLGYAGGRMPVDERGKRVMVYLHHCIMGQPIWDREEIDHINRNPADNRRDNLRWATHSENLINNAQATGQTGMRGTTINNGSYIAQVKRRGINHYLGSFATLDAAVAARTAFLHSVGEE